MREYETVLRQMHRREIYLSERDTHFGLLYYGTEKELYLLHPIIENIEQIEKESRYYDSLCTALDLAMNDLKSFQPRWYEFICLYYFDKPITVTHLGELYGVTRQAAAKVLKKALRFLKNRIVIYFDELWQCPSILTTE